MAQSSTFNGRRRVRKFFGHIPDVAEMPNLIEVQKASYDQFLMVDEPKGGRSDEGCRRCSSRCFPISDFSGARCWNSCRYEFEAPKFDVEECRQRDLTYSAPLKVTLRLIVFDIDEDTGAKSIKDIKEQDVYMGDMPLMTDNGTFIVNGTERVIVSQMHRSPGVFFDHDKGKTTPPASCCSPPASFPIAAPGSTSSSTPRTMSMRVSTAAARFRSRRC
jgi:DNA-directed RNA polymerase subunit beta